MKRNAFLIVAISFSTFSLSSGAVSAQNFPTTSHASFQGQAIMIPEANTSPLPPMQAPTQNMGAELIAPSMAPSQSPYQPKQMQTFAEPTEFPNFSASPSTGYTSSGMQVNEPTLIESVQMQSGPAADCKSCGCADGSCQDFVVDNSQFPEGILEARPRRVLGRLKSRPEVNLPTVGRSLTQRDTVPCASKNALSTIGVSGLLFSRNHGENRNFSTNAGNELLSSDNAGTDTFGGVDVNYARRKANGRGFEVRYFGLYPSEESIQIGNNSTTLLPGLSQIGTAVSGTDPAAFLIGPSAATFFNNADTHVLTRQTELNNLEFNILRNVQPRLRAASTEFLFGFRYFQFGETLLNEAVDIPQGDPMFASPSSIGYFSSVENQLLGLQIGARSDYQIRSRIAMHFGVKAGAYNNNVQTRQRVDYRLRDGSVINPQIAGGSLSGQPFDVGAEDNVKSILGEIDVAVSYQLTSRSRFRVGYRALGATDIAFASNQIQDDFTDATALQTPNTDGDLVLQGGYFGLELAY